MVYCLVRLLAQEDGLHVNMCCGKVFFGSPTISIEPLPIGDR